MKDDVSNLQEHVGYWHNRFGQVVHTGFERRLAKYNITVSQWCLMVVVYQGQGDTVRAIARVICLDVGAVTRLVDRLEEKKLVRRVPDEADGRSVKVELSEEGMALVPRLAKEADFNDEEFYGILSKKEILQFKEILGKLLNGVGTEVETRWLKMDIKRKCE
ncbi:MAG: MarR family transcriptional regulator [Verrucomicrobia bacterium]|nr:MAG: MarR family transcriptional regulator [Verrucomicrobiota bacterium]